MRAILAISALLALSGCTSDSQPEQPAMYLSMANGGATLDPQTAASMISQYRRNNGLGTVVVDPDLMMRKPSPWPWRAATSSTMT